MNKILLSLFLVIALMGTAWANNGWYSTLQGTASDVDQTIPPDGVTLQWSATDSKWHFSYANVPSGGTTGYILTKNSNSNYDYSWQPAGTASNITGLITAGTNITLSGNGTSGTPYVINSSGGGGGTPGGANTQVQYNSNGVFAGNSGFVYNGTNVGINLSSPSYNLDLEGTARISPVFINATGGTVSMVNGNQINTFSSSGNFTPSSSGTVNVLVVAGGGGGGYGYNNGGWGGGGGGAGGYIYNSSYSVTANVPITVTIGTGGGGGNGNEVAGSNGSDSVFGSLDAVGGGGGAAGASGVVGKNGGSGGGGVGFSFTSGGSGTAGQGNNGGAGETVEGSGWNAGGGGGATAIGATALGHNAGSGGAGYTTLISGSSVCYAGGGGGGAGGGDTPGTATCGGGAGSPTGNSGTTNTGGGGGGSTTGNAGSGGSGIVIVSYPIPTQTIWGSSGNIGLGTFLPTSTLSIGTGGVSIGTSYTNGITAPNNGLIVLGNVGIGSTSPGTALDVVGTVRATNFSGAGTGLTGTAASLTAGIASAVTGETFPASGLIVGTTDSQTLTNKTFNGSSNTVSNINLGTQVTGNLPVTNLNSGSSASSSTYWRGDGTWGTPAGSGTITSSTTNQIALFTGSTTVAGATNLWSDNTNVGIGSTAPGQALDVNGTVRASLGLNISGNVGVGTSSSQLNPSTVTGLTFSQGNVSLGTTRQSNILTVNGTISSNGNYIYGTPVSLWGNSYHAFGDSITGYSGSYVQTITNDLGAILNDFAVTGAEACDNSSQIFPNENPNTNPPVYTMAFGTNDANDDPRAAGAGHANGNELNFINCEMASASWLSIPSTFKVLSNSATSSGTWTTATNSPNGLQSAVNGSTLTFSLLSNGGNVYIWYGINDQYPGTFTVSVDGTSTGTTYTTQAINSSLNQNGNYWGVGVIRLTNISAKDAHSILITVTSSTNASNIVEIEGVGTSSINYLYNAPRVFVGGVLRQQNDGYSTITKSYDLDVQSVVATLRSDGLPVAYVPSRDYVNANLDMTNALHPTNAASQTHLAQAFESVMQIYPRPGSPNYGNIGIGTTGSTGLGFATGLVPIIINDNVGINSTNPGQSLDVTGTVRASTFQTNSTSNVIVGTQNSSNITSGSNNTAIGANALNGQNSGRADNTAIGEESLNGDTSGQINTCVGYQCMKNNQTGSNNSAIGYLAGGQALSGNSTAPNNSVFIGYQTKALQASDSNENVLGYLAIGSGNNTTTLGNSSTLATVIPAGGLVIGNIGVGTIVPSGSLIVAQGNVGIGSITPGTVLDVNGTVRSIGSVIGSLSGLLKGTSGSVGTASAGSDYAAATSGNALLFGNGSGGFTNTTSTAVNGGNIGLGTTTNLNGLLIAFGNVGISSSAPGQVLDVAGNIRATGTNQMIVGSDNANYLSNSASSSGDLTFNTNSLERMRIGNGGGVGIGTTKTTTAALSVMNGNVGIGTWIPKGTLDVGAAGTICLGGTCNSTWPSGSSQWTTTNTNDVYLPNSGNVGIGTSLTTGAALTVMNGNVGIGTVSPGAVLDVNGTIRSVGTGLSSFGSNVGIGTTTAPQSLYVVGNVEATTGFISGNNLVGISTTINNPKNVVITNGIITTWN